MLGARAEETTRLLRNENDRLLCETVATDFGAGPVFALQLKMELAPMSVREDAPLKTPVVEVVDVVEQESGLAPEDSRDPEEIASQSEPESEDDGSEDDWETESLYEDALQFISDSQLRNGSKSISLCNFTSRHAGQILTRKFSVPGACTFEEAASFRRRLHAIGKAAFVEETIAKETITAKKLCTAFGIMPSPFLEGAPDKAYHPLLAIGISREYSRRPKLPEYNTIDDAVELLKKSKKIIVLTGAGVCCKSHIQKHMC